MTWSEMQHPTNSSRDADHSGVIYVRFLSSHIRMTGRDLGGKSEKWAFTRESCGYERWSQMEKWKYYVHEA